MTILCSILCLTGHVIAEDHLLPVALARGPSGHLLDFTYQSRDTQQTVRNTFLLFTLNHIRKHIRTCYTEKHNIPFSAITLEWMNVLSTLLNISLFSWTI